MSTLAELRYESRSDLELAADIARRDAGAVRLVMRRNNQRLFRAAWQILRNREDAEDAVRGAYLKAFAAIRSFAGRSSLSTWLTRIVINNALVHARSARRGRSMLEKAKSRSSTTIAKCSCAARCPCRRNRRPRAGRSGRLSLTRSTSSRRRSAGCSCFARSRSSKSAKSPSGSAFRRQPSRRGICARGGGLQRLLGPGLGGLLSGGFPFDRASCERPARPSALSRAAGGAGGIGG